MAPGEPASGKGAKGVECGTLSTHVEQYSLAVSSSRSVRSFEKSCGGLPVDRLWESPTSLCVLRLLPGAGKPNRNPTNDERSPCLCASASPPMQGNRKV